MTDNEKPDVLIAGTGKSRGPAFILLGEDVAEAISEVIARHMDEFRAATAPFGVDFDRVGQPDWVQFVTVDDARHAVASMDRATNRTRDRA
jgi:hypothetical protein